MNSIFQKGTHLIQNKWKLILLLIVVVFVVLNFEDIRLGIIEGWNLRY
jgi:hypothetical protein